MRIRTATAEDVAKISALSSRLFIEDSGRRDPHADTGWPARAGQQYFSDAVTSQDARIFLADESELCGYLLGRRQPANPLRPGVLVVDLESMFVLPERRSVGVGRRLVEAFKTWAVRSRADLLTVTAYADNSRALQFYRTVGFVEHKVTMESPAD